MAGTTVRIFCDCREQRFSKVSHQPRAEMDEESGEIRFDSKEITGIFQEKGYKRTSLVAKTLCSLAGGLDSIPVWGSRYIYHIP